MKTKFLLLLLVIGTAVYGQSPQSMKYQAVARDNSGTVLSNKSVSFRISILSGSVSGTKVFSEIHSKTTNQFGLAELEIGKGTLLSEASVVLIGVRMTFSVKIELDPTGGSSYQLMGTSQLLSVPYALYANKTGEIANNAVTSNSIKDLSIASVDLNNDIITPEKISSRSTAANQVMVSDGVKVSWDYPPGSVVKYTLLPVDCKGVATFNTTYIKIKDIGSFSKVIADSKIEITFNGRLYVKSMTDAGVHFELRVDDIATTLGRARANLRNTDVNESKHVSFTGIFPGLTTGSHKVSIWVASSYGSGTEAFIDPGCWSDDQIIVKEIR